jgi:predicted aconitase
LHLTSEEEKVFNGEFGWAYQVSMRILVRLGDLFGATKLIPIESAHISGVSYKTLGDAPIDFFEALVEANGKVQVPSTVNPSSLDPEYLTKRFPENYLKKQSRVIELYKKMGVTLTLTCTPYYLRQPQLGCHLAWSESSATIYANSVLESWTNREGGPSALAAALIGKTPNYGVHKAENREANILIKVESPLRNETDFGALGIHIGKLLKDEIPVFEGLPNYTKDDLKQLGAGLASSGMATMFHYQETSRKEKIETVFVEASDIQDTIEKLSVSSEKPDLIFIGCPHCSVREIQRVSQALKGKKVKRNAELWVCTSSHVRNIAEKYVSIIKEAGGHVLCDTCAIVTWIKKLGIDTLMTNSAKTAHYAPTLNEVGVTLASMTKCIEEACK